METQKLDLFETFFTYISKLKRVTEQKSSLSIQERVMSFLQLHALRFIKEHPQTNVSQLAHELGMSSSSTAQLLDRLLSCEYIERIHDEQDRRVVHLRLTPVGGKQLTSLRKIRTKQLENVIQYISEKDLKELVNIMHKLVTNIEKKARVN